MYQNGTAAEMEHRFATDSEFVESASATGVGRSGPRTVAGFAAAMAVPPAVVAAVAFPVVAVVVAAVATVAVGVARHSNPTENATEESRVDGPPASGGGAPAD